MMEKYSDVFTKDYKNTEIEIVVEDDVITMAKIFLDGKCIYCEEDLYLSDGSEIPFRRKYYDEIVDILKARVDEMWEENSNKVTAVAR